MKSIQEDDIKDKTDEIFKEALRLVKPVIERDFRPCNLDKHLETVLYDLSYKSAIKVLRNERYIRLEIGVFYASELARSLSKRYGKDFCHYLKMALDNAWIEGYTWNR